MSDGNNWHECNAAYWRKTVGNSEYVCIGHGRESIIECCGDGSCKSRVDGKRLSTGQSVNPSKYENEPVVSIGPLPYGKCELLDVGDKSQCGTSSTDSECYCPLNSEKKSFQECTGSDESQSCATKYRCTSPCESAPNDADCFCPIGYEKKTTQSCQDVTECDPESGSCSTKKVCKPDSKCLYKEPECGGPEDKQCPSGSYCAITTPTTKTTSNVKPLGDTKTYYCRSDRKFVTDLDVPNSQKKDRTLIGKNAATCEKAGFKWTGTKCCSEDDDPNEYYNDPGTIGGCWDKKLTVSIDFVEGTDNSVVNYNGQFHGCAIDKTNFNKNNDNLLSLVDKHTGGKLITNHPYCFNDPGKNFYCSFTEIWQQTDGADRTHFSFAPISNPQLKGGCCAADECWNGENCVDNQRGDPLAQPIGNNSRCIDGEWTNSELKTIADEGVSGYCPKQTQCLINVFGATEANQCIESGQYIEDNYCEDGQWSSRTKLLALKLLKLKNDNFTLFCDNRENTLNNLQYLTDLGDIVTNILANLQTNNFCILKTGNKVIASTSINKNLEDVPANSLNIFGVTDCNNEGLIDDDQYHSCDATNKVWFNKRLKSFIYSADAITIPSEQEPFSSFEEFIGSPIKNIIESIKRLITNPPFDESYLKGTKKFDKLYMTEQGGKSIRGTIEGTRFKNAIIEYIGFETDICKFVEHFNLAKKDVSSGISCKKEGSTYFVLVQGSQLTNINPEQIWHDLTSKLRLK